MSHTALSSAHSSVLRKLYVLADAWPLEPEAPVDPHAALRLALALDVRASALITGIALLRHEAEAAIEAKKGEAA
jgi:hypothetical protein